MKIAFLGLGQMGAAIAAHLVPADSSGSLTVWNRSGAAAGPLISRGARLAGTAAQAVEDAGVVFTMLTDDQATEEVVLGGSGFIQSMKAGAVHVTLSTISVALARRLTEAHEARGQQHLGSPVFGRPQVAGEGKLWLALGGSASLLTSLEPLLALFSRGRSVAGAEPWQAHALKLGGNFMITATIQMMAEAFVYAEGLGIAPEVFIETVNSALFQSKFVENYAKTMLNPPEKAGATVSLGIKDTRLFREAAQAAQLKTPLGDYLAERLEAAKAEGWQNEDWAVGQYRVAQKESR